MLLYVAKVKEQTIAMHSA